MNELLSDTKTVLLGLLGVIVALLTWIGSRLHSRVDKLESNSVTRQEFKDAIDEFRQERRHMHDENRETLERIHERVDDLWKRQ